MKKTISILIAVMMVITAVPMTAGLVFASDNPVAENAEAESLNADSDKTASESVIQNEDESLNENDQQNENEPEDKEEPQQKKVVKPARPARVSVRSIKYASGRIRISWKKVSCSGYRILISTQPNFKKSVKAINVKKSKATSYIISGIKTGRNYYVKMKAYVKYTNEKKQIKTLYSSRYSRVKGISLKTGWRKQYGRMYYYINGKPAKGNKRIKKLPYYFNSKGELKGATGKMWKNVGGRKSKTKKFISVDTKNNVFCVYHRVGKDWVVQKYWRCSTGTASTPTLKGYFSVTGKNPHFGENKGYTCWYATQFYGDYLIHSGTYYPGSKTRVMDNRMGVNISHGCVRLYLNRAKWAYNKVPVGTTVFIY